MLLKTADDKSRRLVLLEELQHSNQLDYGQKKWLKDELMRFRKGIEGERESAHYLDNYFKPGQNHVVLHDLRFVVDGDVAQIDHLILNRTGHILLVETKNYAGDIIVNEHGEFTVKYGPDDFGIPSPLEQSRRHERVLARLLERLEIGGRVDKLPDFHHVVMVHPKAVIRRPVAKSFDTSFLIKADQFPTWHEKFVDNVGAGVIFKAFLNLRSLETLVEWAEKLKRQHQPQDLLALPEFMNPKVAPALPAAQGTQTPAPATIPPAPAEAVDTRGATDSAPAKKLVCAHCGMKISYPEGKFCWNNSKSFNGLQYCREHQALF
ncbi:MAG: hypothetical protein RLZZ591_273 [Pseudomonadota bacterium]|jgi:hypothetical protein